MALNTIHSITKRCNHSKPCSSHSQQQISWASGVSKPLGSPGPSPADPPLQGQQSQQAHQAGPRLQSHSP